MRRNLSYRIFLSDKLKIKVLSLFEAHPPEIKNFKKDKLLYILSLINEIPARNKRNGMTERGFTNLNATLLRSFVWDYKLYLDYLLEYGVIGSDFQYFVGLKSKGFKIQREFVGTVAPNYIQNPELIRRIKKSQREFARQHKQYTFLKKWMDGLEIDFGGALSYIKAQYARRVRFPDERSWNYKKRRYKEPIEQYNYGKVNIYYLKDKRFTFFVDEKVGRLHTNLTNMQSDLRNFVSWKGQKLVSIDISNSQPYLSTLLFQRKFYQADFGSQKMTFFSFPGILHSSFSFKHFFTSSYNTNTNKFPYTFRSYISTITTNTGHTFPLMLRKPLDVVDGQDVKLFIGLVEKGQLYEYLEAAFSRELGVQFTDRKSIKAAVFQVLFTDNRFLGQKDAAPKRIFKKIFPNVYEVFAAYKKEDSTALPCLLQMMEATLILDIICKRISKEKPRVPLFTIHDSVTTTMDNFSYVQRVMKEELTKHIGIEPNLKVEYWNAEGLVGKMEEKLDKTA